MYSDLGDSVDQALISEDADQLRDVVSSVSDWSAIPAETVDYVLKRIGMYGFSGRTDRYKKFAEMILNRGGNPSLFTCAVLKLNGRARELINSDSSLIHAVEEDGNSALHYAAQRGNLELATLLCEQDANVDLLNDDFETPIHLASHAGPWKSEPATELVRLLTLHGATTSLHILAVIGDEQAIRELLERKQIDVNELDRGNRTALFHAAHNNHLQVVQLLLEEGADPNLSDKDGQTPLSSACLHMLSQECDPKIIDCLLSHGASNSLESAIVTEDLPLLSEIVERGSARLDGQDHESPLGYAIHVWRPKSLFRLLELGARPNAANWGHIERIANDPQLVERLRSVDS